MSGFGFPTGIEDIENEISLENRMRLLEHTIIALHTRVTLLEIDNERVKK